MTTTGKRRLWRGPTMTYEEFLASLDPANDPRQEAHIHRTAGRPRPRNRKGRRR